MCFAIFLKDTGYECGSLARSKTPCRDEYMSLRFFLGLGFAIVIYTKLFIKGSCMLRKWDWMAWRASENTIFLRMVKTMATAKCGQSQASLGKSRQVSSAATGNPDREATESCAMQAEASLAESTTTGAYMTFRVFRVGLCRLIKKNQPYAQNK